MKIKLLLSIVSLLVIVYFYAAEQRAVTAAPKGAVVSFLDVGQGLSVFLRHESGFALLYDTGPDDSVVMRLAELMSWQDKKIDLVVISHCHSDHYGGLQFVLNNYQVKALAMNQETASCSAVDNLIESLGQETAVNIIKHSQRVAVSDDLFLDFYDLPGVEAEVNDQSLMLRIVHGSSAVFLPADLEVGSEERLLAYDHNLKSRLLQAGHHGSATSSSIEFLRAIGPDTVIVSTAQNNLHHLPSSLVVNRLKAMGAQVYQTGVDGSLAWQSDGLVWQRVDLRPVEAL